ncbi:single-stranded DNA-binding protein [Leucobacter iarius]|uniref:Single-stranded DNA-binding protein n=1 Tax=Leucobacter iarius TaxID=333963 RepID=A0ABP4XW47_9MICO
MSTPISVVGTIATVPKLIRTGAGVPLCSFRLASSERRYDRERGDWVEGGTNWYSVTAFRSLAEHSHYSFQKGDRVFVSGKLRIRNWENKERSGTSVEIEADALGHELRWGTSRFARQTSGQRDGATVTSFPAPGLSSAGSTGSPASDAEGHDRVGTGQTDQTGQTSQTDQADQPDQAGAPGTSAGAESFGASGAPDVSGASAWTVPGAGVPASAFEAMESTTAEDPTATEEPEEPAGTPVQAAFGRTDEDDGEELPLAS